MLTITPPKSAPKAAPKLVKVVKRAKLGVESGE